MLLRWHYAIDVVAGLGLAAFAAFASQRIVNREAAWREQLGFAPAWPLGPRAARLEARKAEAASAAE